MTSSTAAPVKGSKKAIWSVGYVHGLSHLYMLALPPLFPLLGKGLDVTLGQLAIVLAGFNLITAATQYLAGILVDRFGGLRCLRLGLALSALGMLGAALAPDIWTFGLAYWLAGLANAIYHPADFRLLNRCVAKERRAFGFSIHSFSGNLGFALAPALLAPLGFAFGWRAAFLFAALVAIPGLIALAMLDPDAAEARGSYRSRHRLHDVMNSRTVMQLLVFALFSIVSGGVQGYSVLAGIQHFGYGMHELNTILSLYLLIGTAGILAGGQWLQRGGSEILTFAMGIFLGMVGWCIAWSGTGGVIGYGAGMLLLGFAMGVILPARDLLVARATPVHLQGRTYGFVTTGINIGQFLAPAIIAPLIQHGMTNFFYLLLLEVLTLALVIGLLSRNSAPSNKRILS
ncbi:MFS transporter [Thioclava sp. GXIMD2076]|uniref:MFS transporter n=1 Tax=unclassified Thioclava TaxID=2621713 RepID=UPI0030D19030